MSEPITMSVEMLAWIRQDILQCDSCHGKGRVECYCDADETCLKCQAKRVLLAAYESEREAHKRTQDELQNVREAFIACSETLYAEREQLRHSQEVSKALLSALKATKCSHCSNTGYGSDGEFKFKCNCGYEQRVAAIALAEGPIRRTSNCPTGPI